jgi:glycosyltransferase involved in cell wall biosynthesis
LKENIPLKPIPLPDITGYKNQMITNTGAGFPLKQLSTIALNDLPNPLNKNKKGWPWDVISERQDLPDNAPKVSVIIPSYQQGAYIEEAIRSVLLQSYSPIELIIMDGGSTDETLSVLRHYSDFISFYFSEKDRGQSHAINKGFSVASGDLYYWLNSDDFLNINSFNKVVTLFLKNASLDIVYGDGYTLHEQTGKMVLDQAPLVLERYLRFGGIVLSHSIIWRSHVHAHIWEDLNCAMDAELWLRLFTGRNFKHCLFPIGIARKHPEQKTGNTEKWGQKWKDDYEKYIWKWYPKVKNWKLRLYEYRIVQNLFRKYRNLFN